MWYECATRNKHSISSAMSLWYMCFFFSFSFLLKEWWVVYFLYNTTVIGRSLFFYFALESFWLLCKLWVCYQFSHKNVWIGVMHVMYALNYLNWWKFMVELLFVLRLGMCAIIGRFMNLFKFLGLLIECTLYSTSIFMCDFE